MSILCQNNYGFVVSHEEFINSIYGNVTDSEGKKTVVKINGVLFNICSRFVNAHCKSRKRKSLAKEIESFPLFDEIARIKTALPSIIAEAKKLGYLKSDGSSGNDNKEARQFSDEFYQASLNWQGKCFHGGNSSDSAVIQSLECENYVFPARCCFFSYDVLDIENKLEKLKSSYDLILLDPPWWNKYIRRKKAKCVEGSYQMMYNEDLKKIPVESLLSASGLVAVWCTNSPSHLNSLIHEIFPSWGVKYIGKWFWVKVTQSGEPVCSFSYPPGKQPFEQIIFGCSLKGTRKHPSPDDGKLLVSIPSAIHSHKPPLSEVLSPFLGPDPLCLELFARYLLPNWTSWGYEVLKLQQMRLYHQA